MANNLNKDIPQERIMLMVLQNYTRMQKDLVRLRRKVREQGDKLMGYNEFAQKIKSKKVIFDDAKYQKIIAERDELRKKNKELKNELKLYRGFKKYFSHEIKKREE